LRGLRASVGKLLKVKVLSPDQEENADKGFIQAA
jgi:hypothetical protein